MLGCWQRFPTDKVIALPGVQISLRRIEKVLKVMQYSRFTFAKVSKLFKNPPPLISFRDSPQDGLQQGFSGSGVTESIFRLNSSSTQSIMRMIK